MNNNNTAIIAIKAFNPVIFKGLHDKIGFDFESPITVEALPAPFTIKKAWKAIERDGHQPSTSTAAIIMRDNSVGVRHYMYNFRLVPITADSIRDDFDKMHYWYGKNYRTVLDDFNRKGDFNDLRKSNTCEAYIIAQRNEYIKKPVEHKTDWTQRQRNLTPGKHEIRRPGLSYYSSYTVIIDNSNYRVDIKRDDLKCRAAKLRSEREKAAADLATQTTAAERMSDITAAFNAAKRRIINALEAATPADVEQMDNINEAIDKYNHGLRWIVFNIERFEKSATGNKYTSPDRYNDAFNSIINRLNAIMPNE